ncbi:GNAT family N-acetyltransferase [Rhizomonospora bruguierae]|uniref:GNAT family N-acetyltransferase n=1 Tax=Rhizomonospora bruguierae TaxID=1581705 RepID=UPI001BCB3207|nr:GNAT family N-acetyltransferase [Micromonospora sp. NBRC 107566]
MIDRRLFLHLVCWLGQWPPRGGLDVVGSGRRAVPAWDGRVRPLVGVGHDADVLLSVRRERVGAVRATVQGRPLDEALARVPAAVGRDGPLFRAAFRWTTAPAPLPDAGVWTSTADPVVPPWLKPFNGGVLVATDPETGRYLAGVGIKRHDGYGREISVGTEPAARGRGLARALVAQAARRILDERGIPTYLHALDNHASARVAEAAGFAERGWFAYGMSDD